MPHSPARRLAVRGCAPAAALLLLFAVRPALAAPEEVEVYRDEVTAAGELSVEVNQNYVLSGPRGDAPSGAFSPVHLYRFTPELNYGLARNWEVGALAVAAVRNQALDVHGLKTHVRYIAPRPQTSPWYWGFNAEVGWTDRHLEDRPWTAELRGIAGYEGKRWIVALNPTLETAADSHAAEPVSLELQSKLGYRLNGALILGLESYNAFGPVQAFGPLRDQPQMLYLAADLALPRADLNIGLGHGLTGASDGWAVKLVVGVPLGRR